MYVDKKIRKNEVSSGLDLVSLSNAKYSYSNIFIVVLYNLFTSLFPKTLMSIFAASSLFSFFAIDVLFSECQTDREGESNICSWFRLLSFFASFSSFFLCFVKFCLHNLTKFGWTCSFIVIFSNLVIFFFIRSTNCTNKTQSY